MGGVGRRENEYKLSLQVIVDCLWECCDSKFRGQAGQGDSQRGRVALLTHQWLLLCVRPGWTGHDLLLGEGLVRFMRWASGIFLASQSYKCTILILLQGCFKKKKDRKCLQKVESQPLVKESSLSLELHQRHSSVCSLWPLWILLWEFNSLFRTKEGRKHTHCWYSPGTVKRRMIWDSWGNCHCPFPSFFPKHFFTIQIGCKGSNGTEA